MKRFIYKAKDAQNRLITGEVESTNIQTAAKLVRQRGLIVISLKPIGFNLITFVRSFRDRITQAQVSNVTRQLATMVNAGLPVTESLSILRSQTKGLLQKVLGQILADVESGEPLSKALSKHDKVFTPTYIALVKSGELGGVLDEVLLRLADNLEKQEEFKGKVKGALIYPTIIVIGMIVVGFVMMIFVVPRLTSLYVDFDAELPVPTQILMGLSSFIARFWVLLLVLGGLGLYTLNLYRRTQEGKRKTDELVYKIPIIGELSKKITLTEVTRTLSLMVGSGVSILEGLNITSSIVGNSVISDALRDSSKQVEKGFPVSFAFARHSEAFPYILSQMIAVGEETGKMDEVLGKVSHIFEIEADQKVKALTAAVEPLIMVVLGLGVGFLVIAVILPIYNLTTQF